MNRIPHEGQRGDKRPPGEDGRGRLNPRMVETAEADGAEPVLPPRPVAGGFGADPDVDVVDDDRAHLVDDQVDGPHAAVEYDVGRLLDLQRAPHVAGDGVDAAGGGQRHIAIGESDLAGFGANDAIVVENNVQSGCLRAAGLDEGVVVVEDDVRFAGEGGIIPGIKAAIVVQNDAVAAVDGAGLQPGNCAVIGDGTAVQTLRHCSSGCLLYTSPSPRDRTRYRMPSSA